jgi:hypothetical protein
MKPGRMDRLSLIDKLAKIDEPGSELPNLQAETAGKKHRTILDDMAQIDTQDSLARKYVVSGAARRVMNAKDVIVPAHDVEQVINEPMREKSKEAIEFSKVTLERAQNLLAHFPAGQGWFILFKPKSVDNRYPEIIFANKDLILSDSIRGHDFERNVFKGIYSGSQSRGMKFYATNSPEALPLINQALLRSPMTDFSDGGLDAGVTGEEAREFLREPKALLKFIQKAQALGYAGNTDITYIERRIKE